LQFISPPFVIEKEKVEENSSTLKKVVSQPTYLVVSFCATLEALTIALACSIESQLTNRVEL
jgi:hypothetical protein